MKLLLTSGGITNNRIKQALIELLSKNIEDTVALLVTTSSYAMGIGPYLAYQFITGTSKAPMAELGFKKLGVLEPSVLPYLDESVILKQLENVDCVLVNGGDPLFLYHIMHESKLLEYLQKLNIVYVGLSAGSMIMTPRIGSDFISWHRKNLDDHTFNLVPFSIFPHLNHPDLPSNTLENAKKWASNLPHSCFAIDEQTAFKVTDDEIEIISEGVYYQLK